MSGLKLFPMLATVAVILVVSSKNSFIPELGLGTRLREVRRKSDF